MTTTLQNQRLALSLDEHGRLVSLRNLVTGTELIAHPEAAEAWRLVIPTGRHTLALVYGSQQPPARIDTLAREGNQQLVITYDRLLVEGREEPIRATFTLNLVGETSELQAQVRLENDSARTIDEVEFPVLGGLGGFPGPQGLEARLVDIWNVGSKGYFRGDVLSAGLPDLGRESHHYVREHETTFWEDGLRGRTGLALHGEEEGLFAGYLTSTPQDFAFKLERFPKGVPHGSAHYYPPGTPRWLRLWGVHLPQLAAGETWESEPVTLLVHEGQWHPGATLFAQRAFPKVKMATPPRWLEESVGWTEIVGKLYTGEVFHDFARATEKVLADSAVTGIDLLFYYGHTNLGAEGADFDQSPAESLGGEAGFAEMVRRLHQHNLRVMLLDHLHGYINRDVPEYEALGLEQFAMRDRSGGLVHSYWFKETVLSCRRLAGPTPLWVEMCPACEQWQDYFLQQLRRTIERGVDALELDVFHAGTCYSANHGHEPGADCQPYKLEFLRRVREEAKRLNPDFALICETMELDSLAYCDGWYNDRAPNENARVQRFMLPEQRRQTVLVGNYAYDAANRALMLGLGQDVEIWGLRQTALEGCPDFAPYLGQVNALRRKYAPVLMHGTYRDTLGASVTEAAGQAVSYAVLDGGAAGKALVVRNPSAQRVRVSARLEETRGTRLVLVRPGHEEQALAALPGHMELGPYEAAVILSLGGEA